MVLQRTFRGAGPRAVLLAAGSVLIACMSALHAQDGAAAKRASAPTNAPPSTPAPTMPTVDGPELDRIVAIVNDDLVLDSDVSEEQRFEELQPIGLASGGTRAFDRSRAIERLIDRDLILQQAKMEPGLEVSDADLDKQIDSLRKELPDCKQVNCSTDAGWTRFLAAHGFTPETFRDRWRQRMEVLAFIEERFRAGIRISQADIKGYYDKTLVPEYAREHVTAPVLEKVSGPIQQVLLEQQVNSLLGDWLKQLRAQGSVAVLHPGEPAP